MALAPMIQGALTPAQVITWTSEDGTALNLTGATITGRMRSLLSRSSRAITGTLAIVTAASGIFSWTPSAADVADADFFEVTFTATYSVSQIVKTFIVHMEVRRAV